MRMFDTKLEIVMECLCEVDISRVRLPCNGFRRLLLTDMPIYGNASNIEGGGPYPIQ